MSIFQSEVKSLPKKDEQIVRVPFEKADLAGVPPSSSKNNQMSIQHVPNAGSKT